MHRFTGRGEATELFLSIGVQLGWLSSRELAPMVLAPALLILAALRAKEMT
jgi:hypothetical protein